VIYSTTIPGTANATELAKAGAMRHVVEFIKHDLMVDLEWAISCDLSLARLQAIPFAVNDFDAAYVI